MLLGILVEEFIKLVKNSVCKDINKRLTSR